MTQSASIILAEAISMPEAIEDLAKFDAVLIAGPTASGKSAFALDLAQRYHGALINADSMQVYRDLRVLSARPGLSDEALVPHYLFGHVDGAFNYSVGHWLDDVAGLLPELRRQGRLPIFVGGTGLYFKALTQGLSEVPRVPDAIRAQIRAEAQGVAPELLHARLAACDPLMAARLRPSDPQRLLRALEVFVSEGQSLAVFQNRKSTPMLDVTKCAALFLSPEREDLRQRIETRFEAMLEQGALQEVASLAQRNLDRTLPIMRAHGVPHLLDYHEGKLDLATATAASVKDTKQYARRQFTFARHQLRAFKPVPVA